MIYVKCDCAVGSEGAESQAGTAFQCPQCQRTIHIVSGEPLPDGAGMGDFDASLVVTEGPDLADHRFILGGVADIHLGKSAERQIVLPNQLVSRQHCRLVRLDFDPSRWKIVDNNSTNGLFVNDQRIKEHDLVAGDRIRVGEFVLTYAIAAPAEAIVEVADEYEPAAPVAAAIQMSAAKTATSASALVGGSTCPSCEKNLTAKAKICTDCGIHVHTGRPLLTGGSSPVAWKQSRRPDARRLGAIMGLAGLYLILFPAHRVFCAMWISIFLRFRRYYACKIFPVRGFWVLLIYFGYDVLINFLTSYFHWGHGGVAHWAHIGGFVTGMILGLVILLSRQFNANGGDLLSITLGKNAWPLIGKPSQWAMRPRAMAA